MFQAIYSNIIYTGFSSTKHQQRDWINTNNSQALNIESRGKSPTKTVFFFTCTGVLTPTKNCFSLFIYHLGKFFFLFLYTFWKFFAPMTFLALLKNIVLLFFFSFAFTDLVLSNSVSSRQFFFRC